MKFLSKIVLVLLLSPALAVHAVDSPPYHPPNQLSDTQTLGINPYTDNTPTSTLVEYLFNLGWYFGFNIKHNPAPDPEALTPLLPGFFIKTMLKLSLNNLPIQKAWLANQIQAIIVNSKMPDFLPSAVTIPDANAMKGLANKNFTNYNSSSTDKVSVITNIDQPTYQADPVNQALVNILGTPDNTFCYNGTQASMKGVSQEQIKNCKNFLPPILIQNTALGPIPDPTATNDKSYYSPAYVQLLLNQLNGSTLVAPLTYTTDPIPADKDAMDVGVNATTQETAAANFIRYASGTIIPPKTVSFNEYLALYNSAFKTDVKKEDLDGQAKQFKDMDTLNTYFANMRIFAARISVGMDNLYTILSRRMPQGEGKDTKSQAQQDYLMATRRLNQGPDPDKNPEQSWIAQINNASPETVQKEMAILLAEINYQLYLSRQQQERLLLTQSILLFQIVQPPSNNLTHQSNMPATLTPGAVPGS